MTRIIIKIAKYFTIAALSLAVLGSIGLVILMRLSDPFSVAFLVFFNIWCFGLIWFIRFRARLSINVRRGITITLGIFPILFCYAWMNIWHLEQYLEHRNWITFNGEHFIFHYAPDYPRSQEITSFAGSHDETFVQNCSYLKVSLVDKIDFYIYDKLDEGFAVPGWNVILADDDQSVGHEMTHIIAFHIANERQKIKLLDEGIATWLNHSVRMKDHHYAAWKYLHANGLPSFCELANPRKFNRQSPPPYLPAASFVGYLIDNYGVDAFRNLWTISADYPELYSVAEDMKLVQYLSFIPGQRTHFESAVLKVYGCSLGELENEWRCWLVKRYKI